MGIIKGEEGATNLRLSCLRDIEWTHSGPHAAPFVRGS